MNIPCQGSSKSDLNPPERSQAQPQPEPTRDLTFNFTALLVHGLLGQTGFRLLQAPTFLPAYLSILGGNNAVGIARAVQSLGMFLSPVLSAQMVEHRSHVKGLGLLFGGIMRSQILLIALAALVLPHPGTSGAGDASRFTLLLVWLVLGLWGFGSGLQMVAFNFLLSKTIPTSLRGRLLGLRNSSAGATLFFVSILGGYLIDRYGFPHGYGWTFLLAFGLTSTGLLAVAVIREPSSFNPRRALPLLQRIPEIPSLFQTDPNYTRFVGARLIATAARAARPFYVIYAGEQFELSGGRLAALTIAFTLAESFSALVWGVLADRGGFRAVFIAALSTWMAGTLLMLAAPTVFTFYVVFVLLGSGFGGFMMSSINMVLEFGSQRDRAMRIATTNSLSEAVGALSFLGAGLLAEAAPLTWLFLCSLALQVLAIAQMGRVEEPRTKSGNESVELAPE